MNIGTCPICGQPSFLWRKHPACEQAEQVAKEKMEKDNAEAAAKIAIYKGWVGSVFKDSNVVLDADVLASKRECLTEPEFQSVDLAASLENIRYLASSNWDVAKTDRLLNVFAFFQVPMKDLQKSTKDFVQFILILTLRDLSKGTIPDRLIEDGSFPMLIKGQDEHVIWGDRNSFYAEDKKVRNPGYGGMSVRVLSGVWARVGASNTSYSEGLVIVDEGTCVLTNKAFYFFGQHQSLEIMPKEIISVESVTNGTTDGVVVCKRNQSARNQFFTTNGNGWFVYRAIKLLVSMTHK